MSVAEGPGSRVLEKSRLAAYSRNLSGFFGARTAIALRVTRWRGRATVPEYSRSA
jgi:hypothetical protein